MPVGAEEHGYSGPPGDGRGRTVGRRLPTSHHYRGGPAAAQRAPGHRCAGRELPYRPQEGAGGDKDSITPGDYKGKESRRKWIGE